MSSRIYCLLTAIALSVLGLTACGGDESKTDEPQVSLVLRSQSIIDNQTVEPTLTTVTLYYNNLIELVPGKDITLNGNKAQASVAGMELNISLALEHWKDYKLVIPEGAVIVKGHPKASSQPLTINFNTKIGQDPAYTPTVAESLCNPKATEPAKKIYAYLRDNYGKTMLSGAMGGIAWETAYTDFISQQAGKYPAVVGFDYIHLKWSPADWIDYGDITPVKRVWDAGCIPAMSWHWNVPKYEGSPDVAFYKDDTTFNPANILIPGSWENKVAEADIEKLAGYLKLLQDAGIAVLWRPLHEAAGDYKWGAWFWWGAKGTDVTKQLYRMLYDTLTHKYGLNNLIWVWTVQTSTEGKPAALGLMQDAYPGDDVVDIVGPDVYPDKELTDQSEQFNLVNSVVNGRKIVALTECGNLIDPSKAMASKALWSYFMQWYDYKDNKYGFFNYGGPAQWKTVTGNAAVVSGGELPKFN